MRRLKYNPFTKPYAEGEMLEGGSAYLLDKALKPGFYLVNIYLIFEDGSTFDSLTPLKIDEKTAISCSPQFAIDNNRFDLIWNSETPNRIIDDDRGGQAFEGGYPILIKVYKIA